MTHKLLVFASLKDIAVVLLPALLLLNAPAPEPAVVVETPPIVSAPADDPVYLEDLQRFPPAWLCDMRIEFYDARLAWLKAERDARGGDDLYWGEHVYWWRVYEPAIEDAEVRRSAWVLLLHARRCGAHAAVVSDPSAKELIGYDWDADARYWLRELRDAIGRDAYNQGVLPGPMNPVFMWAGD